MTIEELKELCVSGRFDHATYRNQGTLWEGLWVYEKSEDGFRGYRPAGAFFKDNPDLETAYAMVRDSGVSVGSYGRG